MKNQEIIAEEVGKVTVSMYKDTVTDLPFFEIDADNENVEQVAYIIEDALYDFFYVSHLNGTYIKNISSF